MTLKRHLKAENVMSTLAVFVGITGGSVAIAAVPDPDSVDTSTVIDESLMSRDLMNHEAVKTQDVVNETLEAADLAPDAVGSSEIAINAVTAEEIATGAAGSPEIAGGAVTAGEIATAAVAAPEIAASAVGSSEVALDSINQSEISPSAVGSTEILNNSITGDDVADAALDATEIGGEGGVFRGDYGMGATFEDVDEARNADYGHAEATVHCNDEFRQSGELLYGYGAWDDDGNPAAGNELVISEVRLDMESDQVTVVGGSDDGSQGFDSFHTLQAVAICLYY